LAAGLVVIPTEALAVLVAVAVVTARVLVALELPDKEMQAVTVAKRTGARVVVALAKLGLTERYSPQLVAEMVLPHQLQAHL
jgi:hypothetical protein